MTLFAALWRHHDKDWLGFANVERMGLGVVASSRVRSIFQYLLTGKFRRGKLVVQLVAFNQPAESLNSHQGFAK